MTRYYDSHFIIIHNDSNKEIQSYSNSSSSLTWFSILGKELLAFLHPTIPHLESFYTLNLFHALDIIFDVIVREILQILPMSSGAPFGAVYLKVSITVPVFGLVTNCVFDPLSLSIKQAQLLIHLTFYPNIQMRQDQAEFRFSVYLSSRYDFVIDEIGRRKWISNYQSVGCNTTP